MYMCDQFCCGILCSTSVHVPLSQGDGNSPEKNTCTLLTPIVAKQWTCWWHGVSLLPCCDQSEVWTVSSVKHFVNFQRKSDIGCSSELVLFAPALQWPERATHSLAWLQTLDQLGPSFLDWHWAKSHATGSYWTVTLTVVIEDMTHLS